MADTVRYLMEDMIPELQDLEARGYFSKAELKEVARRRMDFEYRLKRRATLKEDYLRYIAYESELEQLRQLRKQSRGIVGKKTLADYALVRRCHFVFERASRKFAGDRRLWTRWLAFCRDSETPRQTSRVLTKVLQLHPTAAGLWSYAAAWEFEHNANATAARALMQRGLRMCPRSPQLWVEYFRLELVYAQKLRARRQVLGIDDSTGAMLASARGNTCKSAPTADAVTGAEAKQSSEDQLGAEGVDERVGVGAAPADRSTQEAEARDAAEAVLRGRVASVVFRNAIAAVPADIGFRRKFLEALGPFRFPGVEELEAEVYDSIRRDLGASEDAWDILARRPLRSRTAVPGSAAQQASVAVFEEALGHLPTPRMHDLYAAFLHEQLDAALAEASADGHQFAANTSANGKAAKAARRRAAEAAQALLKLAARAADAGCASEQLLVSWSALALRCGLTAEAEAAAERAMQLHPASASVRLQWLSLLTQRLATQMAGCSSEEEAADLRSQLEAGALRAVDCPGLGQDAAPVWLAALEALVACTAPLQRFLDRLLTALSGLALGPLTGGMGSVAAAAVEAVRDTQGQEAGQMLVDRVARLPSPGGDFWRAAVQLESAAAATAAGMPGRSSANAQAAQKRARRVFEAAVAAHGAEDWQLWALYVVHVRAAGGAVGDVVWRATKALSDPDPFRAAMQQAEVR